MECLYSLPPIFARATVRLPLPGLVRRFELANFDQSRSWVGKTPPLRSIIFPLGSRLAGEEKLSARAKSNKYRVGFLKGAINERTGGESSATSIELGSLSRKASYVRAALHH